MTAVSAPEPIPHELSAEPSAAPTDVTPEAGAAASAGYHAPPPPVLSRGQLLFRTLGAAEIHIGGGPVVGPSAERLFTLLALTAMTPDHVLPRSQLLELVWPDLDETGARHSLRQHLYKLKQLGVPLSTTRSTVTLDARCLVPCFALGRTSELFDRDVLRGHEPFGHLFAGWIPSSLVMRRWVEQQRDRFHMDVRRILLPELHRLRDRADWVECERWARTVLEFDPYNEDATLVLAEAIAMLGGRVNARYMLDGYVRETGVAGTDLARHVEAAQRRIGRASRVRHEHSATPTLIGRDAELQRLDALTMAVMQGESKIVHLLGPTGIGKTELAYEATRRAVILGFSRCIVRVTRPMGEVPHGMLSRLVRDLLKLPGALGCRPENLALLRRLAGEDAASALHDPISGTPSALFECIFELTSAVSEEQPLLVFLDDVQLSDSESRLLLTRTWNLFQKHRILFITTERRAALADQHVVSNDGREASIQIESLSLPVSAQLAARVASPSGRTLDTETALLVAQSSDGVPLRIIALAREHLTRGISQPLASKHLDALLRQIRDLQEQPRSMLQYLALFGGRASVADIDTAMSESVDVRLSALRALLLSGLVRETEDGDLYAHDEVVQSVMEAMSRSERQVALRHLAALQCTALTRYFTPSRAATALRLAARSGDTALLAEACIAFSERLAAGGRSLEALEYLAMATSSIDSDELRATLVALELSVAKIASDWQLVLRASSTLRSLSHTNPDRSADLEITEIEASLRSELMHDGTQSANRALALSLDRAVETRLRIRAARLAIGAAADLFDRGLAVAAHSSLMDLCDTAEAGAVEYKESRMQFHTIFGDADEATRLALAIGQSLRSSQLTPHAARILCNAAYVLRVFGETRTAELWLGEAVGADTLRSAPGRRAFAAWQLSLIAADKNDVLAAVEWNDRLKKIVRGELTSKDELWFANHQLRIELLATNEIAEATVALDRIALERGRPSRPLLYSTALALRSRDVTSQKQLYNAMLTDAIEYLSRFGGVVGQDLLASSVLQCLEARGESAKASRLLEDYFLRSRRERNWPEFLIRGLSTQLQPIARQLLASRAKTTIDVCS